jgi:predicted nuclease of predicted toxin-antitoxin system
MTDLASTTFFIDRCLGNKLIVDTLRSAGINVEIHDDHFNKNTQDVDWIPEIGKRGWIILTKDARIGKNKLERLAVANAEVRMFVLISQNLSGSDMAIRDKLRSDRSCQAGLRRWLKEKWLVTTHMFRKGGNN